MIPIYTAEQIKAWDQFTMNAQGIQSIELMEQAAQSFCAWYKKIFPIQKPVTIICGNGNNGGDGLAIARILYAQQYTLRVILHPFALQSTIDFETNLSRLKEIDELSIQWWGNNSGEKVYFKHDEIIIDAIFGIGARIPLLESTQQLIHLINAQPNIKVSVDIPSGMMPDQIEMTCCIQAQYTFTFESVKKCFLVPETGSNVGKLTIGKIGLDSTFLAINPPTYQFTTEEDVRKALKIRNAFDYKNKFGHCLLIAGSHSMPGAMILASESCLRSGAGLLTVCSSKENRDLIASHIPEVMFAFQIPNDLSKYTAIGIGPGLGTEVNTLHELLVHQLVCACIMDADALTILSEHKELFTTLPHQTILTPHPGEFDRVFGTSSNSLDRIGLASDRATKFGIWIVLKGKYTAVCCPDGHVYFNSSGNVSLAKGGSGDVLFGMITSFCAQGYHPDQACKIACYLHGLAADLLVLNQASESILPSDIIKRLPEILFDMHHSEES